MCKNRNRTKSAFAQSFGSFPGPTWSFVLGITFGKMIFFRVLGQPQILLACRKTGRKLSLWKGEGKALISGEKKIFKGSLKWVFGGFFSPREAGSFPWCDGVKKELLLVGTNSSLGSTAALSEEVEAGNPRGFEEFQADPCWGVPRTFLHPKGAPEQGKSSGIAVYSPHCH